MPSRLNASDSFCSVPARGAVAPVSKSARVRTDTPLTSANRSRDQPDNKTPRPDNPEQYRRFVDRARAGRRRKPRRAGQGV
jgi:hypothetical protein